MIDQHGPGGFGVGGSGPMVGRDDARQVLLDALDAAATGRATTTAVVGEAGSGKSVLVQWIAERAVGQFLVVAARPVEGESDLPLAVMLDILRPLHAFLPRLAAEHREVLSAAAGGAGTASSDALLLSAATLALLAAAAETQPLLLVVDDAHWVDPASGRALSFAVRRLLADRVAVVIARRPTESDRIPGHWTEVPLSGFTAADVETILFAAAGIRPAPLVVARIRQETRGNPLAVSHLARTFSASVIAGQTPLPLTLPLQEVARRTFAGLVRALPVGTQEALTVVAAAGAAAAELAVDGMDILGRSAADLHPAEESGLVTVSSGMLEFAHPLYRAAVLEVAGPVAVRQAHAVLAAVTRDKDLQRHAWHRGLSVLGTDEAAAGTLDAAAAAAELRVGAAATVGLRELALSLSANGADRAIRELAAARALTAAGHHANARAHLESILARPEAAGATRAQAFCDLARLMLWDTPLDSQFVAERIPDDLSSRQRAAILAVAALRARNAAELDRFRDLARSAHAEVVSLIGIQPASAIDADVSETLALLPTLSLVAESELIRGAHQAPVIHDVIRRVRRLVAAAHGGEPAASDVTRGLAAMLDDLAGSPAQMLTWTPAVDLASELLALWLRSARARPSSIAYLLMARTELFGWTGDLRGGLSSADRAIELSAEVGSDALTGWTHAFAARICATTGDEPGCVAHCEEATSIGARLSQPGLPIWSKHALALSQLSVGRFDEAVETLRPVADFMGGVRLHNVRSIPWEPDQIEALARAGRSNEAAEVLRGWTAAMPAEPDAWHTAIAARCRVLVNGEEVADELVQAIEGGALRLTPLEEARAQLVCGVALRRRRRPRASQQMLEQAATTFTQLGTGGWLRMAEAELNDRKRTVAARPNDIVQLTVQEMRVSQEIVAGATYREAATRLFCSPKTIEYHLSHVYVKLGIRSRRELASRLATTTSPPTA